jgi:hypothetical protein
MWSVPSQCSSEGDLSRVPSISVGEYGDMIGAARAIKTQTRIMARPIVALLDRTSSEITLRSQAIGDDAHRNQPSLFRRSSGADVDDISDNNGFELSLMVRAPVQSPITQIECVDS